MNESVRLVLQPYLDTLDNAQTTDPALQQQIVDLRGRIYAFMEAQTDTNTYFQAFMDSGLYAEFNDINTRIFMTQQGTLNNDGSLNINREEIAARDPKPAEWLAPFKIVYDQIKATPSRSRGIAVYERLLSLGDRYPDDIQDFLLAMEKENLSWLVSKEDALGIFEITASGMDPLHYLTYTLIGETMKAWKASTCDASITYHMDIAQYNVARGNGERGAIYYTTVSLASHTCLYDQAIGSLRAFAASDMPPNKAIQDIAHKAFEYKVEAQREMQFLEQMGVTLNALRTDKFLRSLFLSPENLKGVTKCYRCFAPVATDNLLTVLEKLILTDMPLDQAVATDLGFASTYTFMDDEKKPYEKAQEEIAEEVCRDIPYFRYEKELAGNPYLNGATSKDDTISTGEGSIAQQLGLKGGNKGGIAGAVGGVAGAAGGVGSALGSGLSGMKQGFGSMDSSSKRQVAGGMAKGIAETTAQSAARDVLEGVLPSSVGSAARETLKGLGRLFKK